MAKSRRKAGGCTRGRFRLKRLGKGWSTHRRQPVRHQRLATIDDLAEIEAASPPVADKPPSQAGKPAAKVAVSKVTKKGGAKVIQPAARTGAAKAAGKKVSAKKAPAEKGTATKASAKKAPGKKAPAKKAPAKKASGKKATAKKSDAKKPGEAKGQDSSST